ncbi:hypothetical protein BH09MYX1_BH09MYX1_53650 [soil metagenome]
MQSPDPRLVRASVRRPYGAMRIRPVFVGGAIVGLASSLCMVLVACIGDGPAPVVNVPNDGAATDALVTPDSAGGDASVDAADADSAVPTTYFDVTDVNNWSSYNLADTGAFGASALGFGGGVLAGKYIYLTPAPGASGNGIMFRYDTTAPFKTKSSWTTYDLKPTVDTTAGYQGAIFDGANVFTFPYSDGKVARFDTTQSFVDSNAWKSYSLTSLYPASIGGGAFDGQYIYTTPFSTTATVVRYDTKGAGFQASAAWSSFGLAAVDSALIYLNTPGFDKRYLYFPSADNSKVARFDTKSAFNASSSWDVMDTTTVSASMKGFSGGIFDGQYIYFPPYHYDGSSVTVRYDTTKPYAQKTSWETLDLTQVDAKASNLIGGTFDGRYVYYPPYSQGAVLVRYDTTKPFTQKTSWQSFGLANVTPNVAGYKGVVFDGEYIYLVPQAAADATPFVSTIPRFHARTPGSVPPIPPSFL